MQVRMHVASSRSWPRLGKGLIIVSLVHRPFGFSRPTCDINRGGPLRSKSAVGCCEVLLPSRERGRKCEDTGSHG